MAPPPADTDHMIVVPHTPREDALRRGYDTWLREVDNPVFNRQPGIVRYTNWRILTSTPAVPFTSIDFLHVASEAAAAELAANTELAEHAATWTRMWGRYPDASDQDGDLNGHLYFCHRLAGHQPTTHYLSLQTASQEPTDTSDDAEIWQVTMPIVGDPRFAYLRISTIRSRPVRGHRESTPNRVPRSGASPTTQPNRSVNPSRGTGAVMSRRSAAKPTTKASVGSDPIVVWAIKHLASPIDRLIMRVGRGRIPTLTSLAVPTLLLTTVGRITGLERTTPLVFVPDGDRFIVANACPAGEGRKPWILNLRAAGHGRVQQRGQTVEEDAHELDENELEQWWPKIVDKWPAFADQRRQHRLTHDVQPQTNHGRQRQ